MYDLDEIVIMKGELKKFLTMKREEIKMGVLLNYVLCNYCDDN